jgi:hypothetical protein
MYTPSLLSPGDAWHGLYESAMLKLDDTKMLTRIAQARTAILDRAEDILTNSSGQERRASNEALQALRVPGGSCPEEIRSLGTSRSLRHV